MARTAKEIVEHYTGEIKKLIPGSDPVWEMKDLKGPNGETGNVMMIPTLNPVSAHLTSYGALSSGKSYVIWERPQKPEDTFTGYGGGVYHNYNRPWVTCMSFSQMPGLCGAVVVHNSFVPERLAHRGLGKLLGELKIEMARNMGYGVLVLSNIECTFRQYHRRILARHKFRDLLHFRNPRSGNHVKISYVELVDNPHGLQGTEIKL